MNLCLPYVPHLCKSRDIVFDHLNKKIQILYIQDISIHKKFREENVQKEM
jgi:hypothetical protein